MTLTFEKSDTISRADVIRLLGAVLLSTTDLDHFLVIHYPEIYSKISAGMQRGQREILLLEQIEPDDILTKLEKYDLARVHQNLSLILNRPNLRIAELSHRLDQLYSSRSSLDREILSIKHQIRAGAQLVRGETLSEGRYRLRQTIGSGALATVWLARDQQSEKDVAVRVLKTEYSHDMARVRHFKDTAYRMTEFRHKSIIRIIQEPTVEDGLIYFTEEFIENGDLERVLNTSLIDKEQCIKKLSDVCDALVLVHKNEAAHGDIKPSNILFGRDCQVTLTDFEFTTFPRTSFSDATIGVHPLFSAPEVFKGMKIMSPLTDIYSMAAVVLFVIIGQDRFQELEGNLEVCIQESDFSDSLKNYLELSIDPKPSRRPSSIADLGTLLTAYRKRPQLNNQRETIRLGSLGSGNTMTEFSPHEIDVAENGFQKPITPTVNHLPYPASLAELKRAEAEPNDNIYLGDAETNLIPKIDR